MWDRVERAVGASGFAKLAAARVAVVGLGSGGGFAALSLAMSGVGAFVLIDPDTLKEVNLVRHVADRRYLGQPKVDAVADLMRQRAPKLPIETVVGRIEDHPEALDGVDLVVCGMDGEPGKYALNQVCLDRGLTAVYAGVYARGDGGDVVIVRPYQGACYACWASAVREDALTPKIGASGALDYGMIREDGTLAAEPGLWIHVARVAAAHADLSLRVLTDEDDGLPGNTLIMANRALEILNGQTSDPQTAVWVTVDRDPACLVCGERVRENRLESVSLADLGVSTEEADDGGQTAAMTNNHP